MELSLKNNENSKNIINEKEKTISNENMEKINYLYPNGHRMTHQMKWFKGNRDKGFESDFAA